MGVEITGWNFTAVVKAMALTLRAQGEGSCVPSQRFIAPHVFSFSPRAFVFLDVRGRGGCVGNGGGGGGGGGRRKREREKAWLITCIISVSYKK